MVRRLGGLFNQAGAVTFDGLVRLLIERAPRYASDLERDFVLTRLLHEVPTTALAGSAGLPGAVAALALLLRQLGESGRPATELERIFARWAAAQPQIADLANDIGRLADACRRAYERLGLEDRPVVVREAADRLAATSWDRPVAFYGFTSFTRVQRSLIERLAGHAEVLVTFTYDSSRDVNLSTPAEISWWRARATRVLETSPALRAYHSPAIAYLERYFMSDEPRPEAPVAYSKNQGVRFMLASGRRAEAELAAEQVAQLIRTGFLPRDIAVVVRSVPNWSALLKRVFSSCGIPIQVEDRPALGQTGLGHAFLNVLKGVLLDDASALLAYMRSPYSGLTLDAKSDLELRYRRSNHKGARTLAEIADGLGIDGIVRLWDMVPVAEGRGRGCIDVGRALEVAQRLLVAGVKDASGANSAIGAGEDALSCRPTHRDGSGFVVQRSPCHDLEEDVRAFMALKAALTTLAGLALAEGEWHVAGGAFLDCRATITALGSVATGVTGGRDGAAVQVMSVQRARARRFSVVLVLGLVEGEFPGRTDRPSLLTVEQTAQLDSLGGGLFTPDTDDEAALFVSAVSRASRLLFLSARNAEDDGSESTPSHFWAWAKRLLGVEESEQLSRTLGDLVFSPDSAPTRRHYERACVALGLVPGPDAVSARPTGPVSFSKCIPTSLTDPDVLAELAGIERFSPSALETYARCPFAWFVQRVVGIEELEVELDGKRVGQLLHTALSEIYGLLDSAGQLPLRLEWVRSAEEIADRIIDRLTTGPECPGSTAERRLACWQLRRMVRNLFRMEVSSGWSLTPIQREMWVGGRHGVDVGGFRIQGRIDRVDTPCDRDGVFVIDYKSGSIPPPSALGSGEALQLPLYLLALGLGRPRLRVLGGAYLGLSDGRRSGVIAGGAEHLAEQATEGCRVLDEEGMEELFRRTREVCIEAINGMRSGNIAPRADRSCPAWCELAAVCRARKGGYRP
jgi:RecB family exonuclease